MSDSAPAPPQGSRLHYTHPVRATRVPGSQSRRWGWAGEGGAQDGGAGAPGSWTSSAPLVRGPDSCPHFLPFLAPALRADGRRGERKGREGREPGGGSTGASEKPGRGLGWGPETDGDSGPGPALPPPLPSRSEPEHLVTLPVPVLVTPSTPRCTRALHPCVAPSLASQKDAHRITWTPTRLFPRSPAPTRPHRSPSCLSPGAPWPNPADSPAMLPRPLRLLWDTSPPGAVVLSSFRSRDPEEGGSPSGRSVGEGQEEEEEEGEGEVRCG